MWSVDGKRYRWSVAFPIIESYKIPDRPKANEVFNKEAMQCLFGHASSTLRPLNDGEREAIADLVLEPVESSSAWIAIEDEIVMAEKSQIDPRTQQEIETDLEFVLEGQSEERKRQIKSGILAC